MISNRWSVRPVERRVRGRKGGVTRGRGGGRRRRSGVCGGAVRKKITAHPRGSAASRPRRRTFGKKSCQVFSWEAAARACRGRWSRAPPNFELLRGTFPGRRRRRRSRERRAPRHGEEPARAPDETSRTSSEHRTRRSTTERWGGTL